MLVARVNISVCRTGINNPMPARARTILLIGPRNLNKYPDKALEPNSQAWLKEQEQRMKEEIERQFQLEQKQEEFLI